MTSNTNQSNLRLIEIQSDGIQSTENLSHPMLDRVIPATLGLYERNGFVPPWIGYVAANDTGVLGTCGFKSPPQQDGSVEIAYFTFPENENRGIATWMAGQLLDIARKTDSSLNITAQTLPEASASTTILTKLSFANRGTIQHPEDGPVWHWEYDG